MRIVLKDRTNKQTNATGKSNISPEGCRMGEKEMIVTYLKDATNKTRDFNLKYDIKKCIEILEGKENQEFTELKDALEEVLLEKELLFKEKCELAVELDHIKSLQEEKEELQCITDEDQGVE